MKKQQQQEEEDDVGEVHGFNMVFSEALVRRLQGLTTEADVEGDRRTVMEEERIARERRENEHKAFVALAKKEASTAQELEQMLARAPPIRKSSTSNETDADACIGEKEAFDKCLKELGFAGCRDAMQMYKACVAHSPMQ